jgi:hypothetical protein
LKKKYQLLEEKQALEFTVKQLDSYAKNIDETTGTMIKDSPVTKELLSAIIHGYPLALQGNMNRFHGKDTRNQPNLEIDKHLCRIYQGFECPIMILKDDSESKPPFESCSMSIREFMDRSQRDSEFAKMHYLQQVELDDFDGKYVSRSHPTSLFGLM